MQKLEFGSIRQIHERLIAEGYAISVYALRQWVKSGRIPAVYSGTKAYIRYDSVLAAISGECATRPA